MSVNKTKIKVTALKPPPKGRAVEPFQKENVLSALMDVWKRYPYFRLGQLLCCIITNDNLSRIEDSELMDEFNSFNTEHGIECGVLSHSRTIRCTLEKGHGGDRHFNTESGLGWRRF